MHGAFVHDTVFFNPIYFPSYYCINRFVQYFKECLLHLKEIFHI